MSKLDESTGAVSAVRQAPRPRGWRRTARAHALGAWIGLAGVALLALPALAQDFAKLATWTIRAQAAATGDPADQLCLIACGQTSEIVCAAPDTARIALFSVGEQACVQAIAKNAGGTSGPSVQRAYPRSWRACDCNRDDTCSVSDFLCVNAGIFSGG